MGEKLSHNGISKQLWRQANSRLIPSAILMVAGAIVAASYGNVRTGDFAHRLTALLGIVVFASFAIAFLRTLTSNIYRLLISYQVSTGRAAAIRFGIRVLGYTIILLITLSLFGVPVGKLLVGGAALGIILGVAAQQSLSNFFASIALIISRPFSVGDSITLTSGPLGGTYVGKIKDIGLTHTTMEKQGGDIVLLPNSAILSGATIIKENEKALPKAS